MQYLIPVKHPVKFIENMLFIRTPRRGNQVTFCSISGQAMNHHVGRNDFDTLFQHEDIFFQGQLLEPPALIVYGKICSFQNMQELELDAFSTARANVPAEGR